MDIDVTRYFHDVDHSLVSGSCMELGEYAPGITWRNAMDKWEEYPLLDTDDKREVFRDWVRDFGAWDREEIASWTDEECNALFLQFVSGNIREAKLDNEPGDEEWAKYQDRAERGNCSSNLFRCDDGRVIFSLSR